ncbi:uncharacterized protein CLAFUR5_04981 [Fulvia fulva]|uniref:Uncharacterized protein n=1 Tax=Passalora fulva TaxID=5499 RepID=A0A9Q8LFJ2_PASFU|nr:uncharacterized protein CLAFUR5_04981 [Fulvia fulva]KAK4617413.1 hypothetical protein CLAFUR0_10371 [Fulvia fulva]UJO15728.1 hypothetical protein CLAFUR5_04981 [Fulvia fulva]
MLDATGCTLMTVVSVSDKAGKDDESIAATLKRIGPSNVAQGAYVTGEPLCDAWLRSLTGDLSQERHPERINRPTLDQLRELSKPLLDASNNPADAKSLKGLIKDAKLKGTITRTKFFTTNTGHFGFGPVDMQAGDRNSDGRVRLLDWVFVHGIMDGEALLGPLPKGWSVHYKQVDGRWSARFIDPAGAEHLDDPRLGPLPRGWSRKEVEITADDPIHVDHFENRKTGEVINYDPRMSVEAIEERGTELETIRLV